MTTWPRPLLYAMGVAWTLGAATSGADGGGAPDAVAPVASAKPSPLSASPKATIAPVAVSKKPASSPSKAPHVYGKSSGRNTPGVRVPDPSARRSVAGGPTADDVALGPESPELRALHQAELELFPPAIPPLGAPWPSELASPLSAAERLPHVHATGLPPKPPPRSPKIAEGARDVAWLSHLELPDLPVRWDARLVRYLEFYRDDPRGRQLLAFWIKRSGRYRDAIRRALRQKALPEDLSWLPLVESGYDPVARSPAGAAGLWQLTADTAHLYGLSTERWADQRLNPLAETDAALEMLADLNRRFGSWELALAAYNMGYGGVMSVVRRYNTNDYWTLSRLEAALPWETTLYVPKLVAIAIVGRNLGTFGLAGVVLDAPVEGDEVRVPPGTSLQTVASAAGVSLKDVEALNLELRAGRTPPLPPPSSREPAAAAKDATYPVRVPVGKGAVAQANLARSKESPLGLERYVVKFGESLEQVAAARKMAPSRLAELNALAPGEVVRGGTVLLVPRLASATFAGKSSESAALASSDATKPVVVVPPEAFVYEGRRRVFYRVLAGDTLAQIATHLHVEVDDLRRWNDVDPAARLQEGMTLQAFVPEGADLSSTVVFGEHDARVLVAGTDEFFSYWEGTKGKKRVVVTAKAGDTLESIARAHGVNTASMERINGRGRRDVMKEGETVVVYLPAPGVVAPPAIASTRGTDLTFGLRGLPNGILPFAPQPSLLPPLP